MTLAPPSVQATSLYFREGLCANEFHAAIEPKGGGYIVTFAYYRHGSNLTVGTKTPDPVALDAAIKVFDRLIASKLAKGYQTCFPGRLCRPGRDDRSESWKSGKTVLSAIPQPCY